jgi:ATP phosphoribosyltransferase regulatory subunit
MGLEHLGGEARAADVEVLAVAAECLDRLGASGWVIALGHVGVFGGLVAAAGTDPEQTEMLRSRVEAKDVSGVRDILAGARTPPAVAEALVRLSSFAGDAPILRVAEQAFAAFPDALRSVRELQGVVAALDASGLLAHVAIDLGEVRGLDYYTGFVFRVYARGLGFEVGGGGRYDTLLARFGRPMPAVGFMLGLDRVALLLQKQDRSGATTLPKAKPVHGADLGVALRDARALRADGRRVRFGNGDGA